MVDDKLIKQRKVFREVVGRVKKRIEQNDPPFQVFHMSGVATETRHPGSHTDIPDFMPDRWGRGHAQSQSSWARQINESAFPEDAKPTETMEPKQPDENTSEDVLSLEEVALLADALIKDDDIVRIGDPTDKGIDWDFQTLRRIQLVSHEEDYHVERKLCRLGPLRGRRKGIYELSNQEQVDALDETKVRYETIE